MAFLRVFLIAACCCLVLGVAPSWAGKKDDTLRVASAVIPESIDGYFNNVREGVVLSHHIWSNLIYRNPKTDQYEPELATSWKWIDDRTLELELRHGVKFHNGDGFSADDVVYTLNFIAKPSNKVIVQQNVNWIESCEKIDDYKVRIKTRGQFPAALEYLSGPVAIYPGKYYEKVGPKGMNEKAVGSGPYRVVENIPGRIVRMERNPDYFKDSPLPKPTIGKIDFRLIPEQATQLAELMSGGLDWIWRVPPDQAAQLKSVPTMTVASTESMRIAFLQFNATESTPTPALRDVRVRQAISHAIDREAMVKNLVGEGSKVLNTLCFRTQFGCTDEGAPRYGYDVAKAKQLMAEAGQANGFDVDIWAYRDRDQTEAIVNYLRAINIRATIRYAQYSAIRDALRANKASIIHQTWGSYGVNDASASTSVFLKFEDDDIARDAQVKDWLTISDTSVDDKVRKDNYKKSLSRAAEQALVLPLFSIPNTYAFTKDLDFTPWPDELPRFFEAKWK